MILLSWIPAKKKDIFPGDDEEYTIGINPDQVIHYTRTKNGTLLWMMDKTTVEVEETLEELVGIIEDWRKEAYAVD